jgi:hypothetical protein
MVAAWVRLAAKNGPGFGQLEDDAMPELAPSVENRGNAAGDNRGSGWRDQHRRKRAVEAVERSVDADRGLVESLRRGEAHAAEDLVDKFGARHIGWRSGSAGRSRMPRRWCRTPSSR